MQRKMLKKHGNLLFYSTYNSTKNKHKQNVGKYDENNWKNV